MNVRVLLVLTVAGVVLYVAAGVAVNVLAVWACTVLDDDGVSV